MSYSIDRADAIRGIGGLGLSEPLTIVQNCYVVKNLVAACQRLHETYRVGPFVGGSVSELSGHKHRGSDAPPIVLRSVFVQSGNLNVELVELHSDAPSAFHDMYPEGGEGLHHTAVFTSSYELERDRLVDLGFPIASEFKLSFGPSVCYLDARTSFGHMIELCPNHEIILDRYQQAREAASQWDGEQLIVPWKSFGSTDTTERQ